MIKWLLVWLRPKANKLNIPKATGDDDVDDENDVADGNACK